MVIAGIGRQYVLIGLLGLVPVFHSFQEHRLFLGEVSRLQIQPLAELDHLQSVLELFAQTEIMRRARIERRINRAKFINKVF